MFMVNLATSRRTIPYTMSYNPGLVFLNLYDYPGPTLSFSDELEAFRSPDRDTGSGDAKAQAGTRKIPQMVC